MMKPQSQSFSKSLGNYLYQGLTLLKYHRLILLLGILALGLGLAYYSYTVPVYEVRASIRYDIFQYEVRDEAIESRRPGRMMPAVRDLLIQLRSPFLLKLTAESMGLVSPMATVDYIRSSHIQSVRVEHLDSGIAMLTVLAYDREVARQFPEAMVKAFNTHHAQLRTEQREQLLLTYRDEMQDLSKKVDDVFDAAEEFESANSLTEIFIEQNQLTQVPREMIMIKHRLNRMANISEALQAPALDNISQLSLLSSFSKEPVLEVGEVVARIKPDERPFNLNNPQSVVRTVVEPSLVETPDRWVELEKELRAATDERKRLSETFLPGHSRIIALDKSIAGLTDGLDLELQIARERFALEQSQLEQRLTGLEGQLPEYRGVLKDYERQAQKFGMLQGGKEAWSSAYQSLTARIEALEFEKDRNQINLRFGGFLGLGENPVSPNKRKLLFASLALALALGIGVPLLMELLNDSVERLEDLEKAVPLRALGIVPLTEPLKLESIVREPEAESRLPDFLLENFRIIRSGIALDKSSTLPSQAIMVASARPSEGKTVVSANLAWAFSSIGEKTLIIDADLRRGRQHTVLDLPNDIGLSQVLAKQCSLEEAIQATEVPGLDFIPRGPIIAGISEKLCMDVFEEIIAVARQRYDRIIVDTPPVLGLSETPSLQRLLDGVVLVVRAEQTPKRDVVTAVELLTKAGGSFYGFILNRLDLSTARNYYNYYYYSPSYYLNHAESAEQS